MRTKKKTSYFKRKMLFFELFYMVSLNGTGIWNLGRFYAVYVKFLLLKVI